MSVSLLVSAQSAFGYHRHRPEQTLLYQLVEQHFPAFVSALEANGGNLPTFVRQEFDDYLKCGLPEHGFLRVKCDSCRNEHLVAFVCYILLCFGGGFATVPSFVLDVFGSKRMSVIYGAMLTAWAAAGIFGPLYVGSLKDQYPDRAVIYCFLIGILILGLGYVFTYLLSDDRFRAGKPTVEDTLRQFGIVPATR